MPGSGRTYYEILGVAPEATRDEIVRAFRRLAIQFHPDNNPSPYAAAIFTEVTDAYRALSDPSRRRAYDATLASSQRAEREFAEQAAQANRAASQRAEANATLAEQIAAIYQAKSRWAGSFGMGFLWAAGGALVSLFTYSSARGGGYYLLFWGPLLFGGYQMVRAGYYWVQLWQLERALLGKTTHIPQWVWVIPTVAVITFVATQTNFRLPTGSFVLPTFAPTRTTTASAEPTSVTTAPTVPTRSSPPTPPGARTPTPTRAVSLRPEQMILPPFDFPFQGYDVTRDQASGAASWFREFRATVQFSTSYHYVMVALDVNSPLTSGYQLIAAATCRFVDPERRPVRVTEITAEVVGDGAKACRYDIGDNIRVYDYFTAERNVLVQVRSNTSRVSENAEVMRDAVTVARLQITTIQRVAPR